jgi:hypothetical protein
MERFWDRTWIYGELLGIRSEVWQEGFRYSTTSQVPSRVRYWYSLFGYSVGILRSEELLGTARGFTAVFTAETSSF